MARHDTGLGAYGRWKLYRPGEIIVVRDVLDDPITQRILERCPAVPVRIAETNTSCEIIRASRLLSATTSLGERAAVGKRVLALVGTVGDVDWFHMADPRMGCPTFMKLVTVSNGCPGNCLWCFLKGTYRARHPYIAVHVRYKKLMRRILRVLPKSAETTVFNMGELQDGLALEHLSGAAQTLIPFFADLASGRLFLLTKSDNVNPILDLDHRGHTILGWSLNAPEVSRDFELGTPSFDRRLRAAAQAQQAGYPIRVRLDPIMPLPGWRKLYEVTIHRIFQCITPERVTLGTLRFETQWYRNRRQYIAPDKAGLRLLDQMAQLEPMLSPVEVPTSGTDKRGRPRLKTSIGKYSYPENQRLEIFRFTVEEIRKRFDGPLALCKETVPMWRAVGLDPHRCQCVCQYEGADIVQRSAGDYAPCSS